MWFREEEMIELDGVYSLTGGDNENLRITNISSAQEGNYRCQYMANSQTIQSDGNYCVTIVGKGVVVCVSTFSLPLPFNCTQFLAVAELLV